MSSFSKESLELRRELVYACRILAANGQNDTVYGHVTYSKAGEDTFWLKNIWNYYCRRIGPL